jgi:Thiopurine S-methyltransferase (TPMT).
LMSNQQWKAKWKRDDIAFHQSQINPLYRNSGQLSA